VSDARSTSYQDLFGLDGLLTEDCEGSYTSKLSQRSVKRLCASDGALADARRLTQEFAKMVRGLVDEKLDGWLAEASETLYEPVHSTDRWNRFCEPSLLEVEPRIYSLLLYPRRTFCWNAACSAAALPARRPKTEPAVRPLPPG
jgi:hypothetical protein